MGAPPIPGVQTVISDSLKHLGWRLFNRLCGFCLGPHKHALVSKYLLTRSYACQNLGSFKKHCQKSIFSSESEIQKAKF
jgi:hypothetical protein